MFAQLSHGDNYYKEFFHTNELIYFTKGEQGKNSIVCNFFDYANAIESNDKNLIKIKSFLYVAPTLHTFKIDPESLLYNLFHPILINSESR